MLLISTERFETWREEVLVVSESRYDVIDRFTQARIAQPDCIGFKDFRLGPRGDKTIAISTHREYKNQACVIQAAGSCDFLSGLINLPDVNWTAAEIQTVKDVRNELSCKVEPEHSE
jgi:hypothetical protein